MGGVSIFRILVEVTIFWNSSAFVATLVKSGGNCYLSNSAEFQLWNPVEFVVFQTRGICNFIGGILRVYRCPNSTEFQLQLRSELLIILIRYFFQTDFLPCLEHVARKSISFIRVFGAVLLVIVENWKCEVYACFVIIL